MDSVLSSDDQSEAWWKEVKSLGRKRRKRQPRIRAPFVVRRNVFSLHFDTRVLDGSADMALKVKLLPFEIVFSKTCVERLEEFCRLPALADTHAVFDELEMSAINALSNFRERTEAKLEVALRTHAAVSMDIDVRAPVVIFPQDELDEASRLMVIDLGRLTVKDRVIRKMKRDGKKGPTPATAADPSMRFYDEYEVRLSSVQVIMATASQNWRSRKMQRRLDLHLVERFALTVGLGVCVIPHDHTLPRFKLSIALPAVRVKMSPRKYAFLLKLLDKPTPPDADSSKAKPKHDDGFSTTPLSLRADFRAN